MANDITIDIRAFNAASPELAKFQKDVEAATKGIQESAKVVSGAGAAGMRAFAKDTDATGKSLRDVLQPLKLFSENIAQQVSPALGGMVTGLGAASREGAKFSLSMSALVVGTATAASAFAIYIQRLNALT